ncbi:MAG TPA: LapA family protein [Roseiflexaceae bacterium]|nr:LapA family protein [Roseiflexaceae bacterium]
MRWLILLPVLALALLMVIFGVQNTQLVTVRFLSFEARDLSASIVIILSAIGGALLAGMLGIWNSIQHGLRGRRDAKTRAQLEQRIADLERQLAAAKNPAPKPPQPVDPPVKK